MNEILEKEKLIAEFMGGVRECHPIMGWGYRFNENDMDNRIYGSKVSFIREDSLSFSSNWNHLWSVLAKIHQTIECPTNEEGSLYYNNTFQGFSSFLGIYITFLEVAAFIEWYNSVK